MSSTKRAILLPHICILFLSLPVCMNAQEKDSSFISFYIPSYTPDAVSFFASEYQNALANQNKSNWYFTALMNDYQKKIAENDWFLYSDNGQTVYEFSKMNKLALSTGISLPVWRGRNGNTWSLVGHYTALQDSVESYHDGSYFAGAGIRADYGVVTAGILGGNYGGLDGKWDASGRVESFRLLVPVSFGLSEQVVFLDRVTSNFGFGEHFALTQLLADIAFAAVNIGAVRFGINVYYKNEVYNTAARQQKIGAAFTTKHLQFDGGYRFFDMNIGGVYHYTKNGYSYYYVVPPFDDGPYARLMLKLPFDSKGAVAVSAAIDDIYQSDGVNVAFGVGISLFGSKWQTLVEGSDFSGTSDTPMNGSAYLGTHVNLRANN